LSSKAKYLISKKGLLKIQPIVFLSVLLCGTIIAVYWPLKNNGFINFDDNLYVADNETVKRGLTPEGIKWAFRFNDKGYWQPLAWLSHMLDCELYGLNPAGHHLTNLMIHLANTLLLFWLLSRATGCVCKSACVAALFALHPLNVESVAWLAERKNVLSTFFWLLTIYIYTYYVRKHNIQWYLGMVICFVLGLMTKPMAVTLPFLMLLLDFWPLARIQIKRLNSPGALIKEKEGSLQLRKVRWPIVVLEKIPFLILSTFSVVLSILSLQHMDIMVSGSIAPLNLRIANALVSYVSYINKMIWPRDLAIFYPYPKLLPTGQILGSVLCLLAISILCIAVIKRRPYLSVGWFWYVGTLVPVIGIVQTGVWPAMADRWAYVPLMGLFIIIVWGFSDIFRRSRYNKLVLVVLYSAILMGFANSTHIQLRHWVGSIPLFQHALQITGDNEIAYYSIGNELVQEGRLAKGMDFYRSALRLKPGFSQVHNNLGVALARTGNLDEAVDHFQIALQIKPNYAEAHNNLGVALRSRGQLPEAGQHYAEALRLDPAYAEAFNNFGLLLMQQGKIEEALSYFKKALEKKPDFVNAQENFKKASLYSGINN